MSGEKQFVEKREQGYWLLGTRVSLDSVVSAFLLGLSPETIAADCYPVLTLEQIYGAIAYYLGHRTEIEVQLQENDIAYESLRQKTRQADPQFVSKLAAARRQVLMA